MTNALLRVSAVSGSDPLLTWAVKLAINQRQAEALRLLLRGLTNAEIAVGLGITAGTVKQHVRAVYAALGVFAHRSLDRSCGWMGWWGISRMNWTALARANSISAYSNVGDRRGAG